MGKCQECGKQHFGHCHKCPHDADVKAGKYADMDFAKVPCFACRLPVELKVSGHGATVPLDESFMNIPQIHDQPMQDSQVEVFARVMSELWSLPFITREIVARRLQGHKWEDIASTLNLKHAAGLTLQACHLKLKAAIGRSESLQVLFAAMVMKQNRRKENAENIG